MDNGFVATTLWNLFLPFNLFAFTKIRLCMFCQSTSKCLPFPLSRLGMVSWSDCPPNLSSLYWYSCRLSYAYVLALAIAIFVFLGLLLLCCCAICVMHRRRNFRNRIIFNFSGNASVGDNAVLTSPQGSLPPYGIHRLLEGSVIKAPLTLPIIMWTNGNVKDTGYDWEPPVLFMSCLLKLFETDLLEHAPYVSDTSQLSDFWYNDGGHSAQWGGWMTGFNERSPSEVDPLLSLPQIQEGYAGVVCLYSKVPVI
ncbi:hypothetical protein ACTXT7_002387 [Hymenolepis weldensis]